MGVETVDAQYERFAALWKKARDVCEGQDVIHEAGTEYLPKLTGMTESEYSAYKKRALFYNATGRTVDGLTGMVFRKEPLFERPEGLADFENDVNMAGQTLREFTEMITTELIQTGRGAILVDYPQVDTTIETRADAESRGLRAYMTYYRAEQILGVRAGRVNNRNVVTRVRLKEVIEEEGEDEFVPETVEQIRVLELDEMGQYQVRLFQIRDEEVGWAEVDVLFPTMNGERLNFIPLAFLNATGNSPRYTKAPIMDLVFANLDHYLTSADYAHGTHLVGLPTPVITGYDLGEGEAIRIGSMEAIVIPDPNGDAKYMELAGQGFSALEKKLDRIENQMAVLGMRMIAAEKRQVETAEAHQIKRQGENSVIATLTGSIESAIRQALLWVKEWEDIGGEVTFSMNRDYLPTPMTPQEITALIQLLQAGRITRETLYQNLQRGEIIDAEKQYDEYEAELQTENSMGI